MPYSDPIDYPDGGDSTLESATYSVGVTIDAYNDPENHPGESYGGLAMSFSFSQGLTPGEARDTAIQAVVDALAVHPGVTLAHAEKFWRFQGGNTTSEITPTPAE